MHRIRYVAKIIGKFQRIMQEMVNNKHILAYIMLISILLHLLSEGIEILCETVTNSNFLFYVYNFNNAEP